MLNRTMKRKTYKPNQSINNSRTSGMFYCTSKEISHLNTNISDNIFKDTRIRH